MTFQKHQWGGHQKDSQQRERVDHSRYWRKRSGTDVGHGTSNRTGCGYTSKLRRGDIGKALRDQPLL